MAIDPSQLPYRPCVGIVLMNAQGNLFAGQRKDSDLSAWQMPQGGIDDGESVEETALRELEEETGIPANLVEIIAETPNWLTYDLPADLIGTVWKGRFRGQRQKWILMRFLGQDSDVNIATSHQEFSDWCWLEPHDMIAQIVPFKREIYTEVIKGFESHLQIPKRPG